MQNYDFMRFKFCDIGYFEWNDVAESWSDTNYEASNELIHACNAQACLAQTWCNKPSSQQSF